MDRLPSPDAFRLSRQFESLRLEAYWDRPGHVWTIGYGHTHNVKPGMRITEPEAEAFLQEDMQAAAAIVTRWVTTPLSQSRFDALCDFCLNVGPGAADVKDGLVWLKRRDPDGSPRHSTMLLLLNAGNFSCASKEFAKWAYAGGEALKGLRLRREAERALFERNDDHPT